MVEAIAKSMHWPAVAFFCGPSAAHARSPCSNARRYLTPGIAAGASSAARRIGILVAAFAFVGNAAWGQSPTTDLEQLRQESLQLVNDARSKQDLSSLQFEAELNEAAQAHAEDMLKRQFYDHVSPEGDTVMDRYIAAGGSQYRLVAENIARCRGCRVPADETAVRDLHQGWMNSPEHRENILAEGLSGYGFGIAENETGTRYSVQTFEGPGVSGGPDASGPANEIDAAAQSELVAALINDRRRADGIAPISADRRLVRSAQDLIPEDISGIALDELGSLQGVIPAQAPWRSYQMIVGSCGGCGVRPTEADVRFFVGEWLDDARYRRVLTDPDLTSIGLAIEADQSGRKIAAAILGG